MSLAWGTVSVLVLLLPGFLFQSGTYIPSGFSRDSDPQPLLTRLAGVVLVSFLLHAAGLAILGDRVAWPELLELLQVPTAPQYAESGGWRLPEVVRQSLVPSALYVTTTCGVGLLLGWGYGSALVHWEPLRNLSEHNWAFQFRAAGLAGAPDNASFAYVLTDIDCGAARRVMYMGVVAGFGIRSDGTFSYLSLRDPMRSDVQISGGPGPADAKWERLSQDDKEAGKVLILGPKSLDNVYLVTHSARVAPKDDGFSKSEDELWQEARESLKDVPAADSDET